MDRDASTPLGPQDVLTIWQAGGAVSLRIFAAEDCQGNSLSPQVVSEGTPGDGGLLPYARVVMTHYEGDGGAAGCAAPVALLLATDECDAGTCATVSQMETAQVMSSVGDGGTLWTVTAATPEGTLRVTRSALTAKPAVLERTVDGSAVISGTGPERRRGRPRAVWPTRTPPAPFEHGGAATARLPG